MVLLLGDTIISGQRPNWITCALITNHITALTLLNFVHSSVTVNHCLQIQSKWMRSAVNWILPVAQLSMTSHIKQIFDGLSIH